MDSSVISTFIGAGIALLGVFFSQIVVLLKSYFDKQHQQRVLIQSKYEQLVEQFVVVFEAQLQVMQYAPADSKLNQKGLKPHDQLILEARRFYSLTLLYFPLLEKSTEEYYQTCARFSQLMSNASDDTIKQCRQTAKQMATQRDELELKIKDCADAYARNK